MQNTELPVAFKNNEKIEGEFFAAMTLKGTPKLLEEEVQLVYATEEFSNFLKSLKGEMKKTFEDTVRDDNQVIFYYLSYKSKEGRTPILVVEKDFNAPLFYFKLLRNFDDLSAKNEDKNISLELFAKENQLEMRTQKIGQIQDIEILKKSLDACLTKKMAEVGFVDVKIDFEKDKIERVKVFQTNYGSDTRLMSDLISDEKGQYFFNYSIEFRTVHTFKGKLEINVNIFLNHFASRGTENIGKRTKNQFYIGEVGKEVTQFTLNENNTFSEKEQERIKRKWGILNPNELIDKNQLELLATGDFKHKEKKYLVAFFIVQQHLKKHI